MNFVFIKQTIEKKESLMLDDFHIELELFMEKHGFNVIKDEVYKGPTTVMYEWEFEKDGGA